MLNNNSLTTDKKSFADILKKIFRRRASLDARKARAGYGFVLPFILGVLLVYLPILIDSIWFSFNKIIPVTGEGGGLGRIELQFMGLQYYQAPFANSAFTERLLAGLQQLLFEVPAIIVFSLFIAVVLNNKMLGRAVFRAIFFVPVIISTGIMDSINLSDQMSGSAGSGMDDGSGTGASDIISVLDVQKLFASMKVGGELVTYVVGIVNNVYNIINYSGVQMLIFLAGLQSISPSIYEACRIDGATGWETFWKITFPMISPMILVNAVYTIIDAFTTESNTVMSYISSAASKTDGEVVSTAMAWIYFLMVVVILAAVAGIMSMFVFYQRRD